MRYVVALLIKLGLLLALLALLLPLVVPITLAAVLDTALLIWAASFIIGDLLVLPAAGAAVAAVVDLVLVAVVLMVLLHVSATWGLLGIAVAAAVVEFFFHDALIARGVVRRGARA